jgi:hypothetical protein
MYLFSSSFVLLFKHPYTPMKRIGPFVLTTLVLCSAIQLQANNCATATSIIPNPLSANSTVNGSFAGAGYSGVSQCAGPGGSDDVWYSFTATASRMFIAAQGDGDIDIAIEVYDACGGASIACQNTTGPGALEVVSIPGLTVGSTYYFAVFHAGGTPAVSEAFSASVYFIPYVELRAQDCNIFNYTSNSIIRSTQPAPSQFVLTNYQFRFEELEFPFNTYEVISPNGTNPNYRLEWFAPIQYGRTYEVSVRIRVSEGGFFGDYGNSCTIGLQPNVLTTRLQNQFANGTFNFCSVLGADKVGAASRYRWNFNDLVSPVNVFGVGDSRLLSLQTVPGLKLNQTYIVSVFAEVNGDESPTGTLRFISTVSSVPNTGINTNLYPCGQTYPINATLQAVEICSAASYTWRFQNTSQIQSDLIYTRSDGSRFLKLDWVTGLIVGDSYNVSVRAAQGNLTGNYSSICNITIGPSNAPGGQGISLQGDTDQLDNAASLCAEVKVLPGTEGTVSVAVQFPESEGLQNQPTTLEVYSVNGTLVAQKNQPLAHGETFFWNTGVTARGVYIVKITQGPQSVTKRIAIL